MDMDSTTGRPAAPGQPATGQAPAGQTPQGPDQASPPQPTGQRPGPQAAATGAETPAAGPTAGPGAAARPAVAGPTAIAVRGRGLTKLYGHGEAAVRALDGVDVDFAAGAFTAIMGPSGSGKSTLMHLLAGLDTVTSGTVHLGATEVTALDDRAMTLLRRARIGFVFQSFNLLPMFTAEQNITLPLMLAGTKLDRDWFDTLVATLDLGNRLGHRPGQLSGGQQQRVAIARALVTKPEVIFADEPTGNLDTRSGIEVLAFLRRSVRELGRTVVMVTHDPSAAAYAERVVLLADGRVAGEITEPTPESVLAGLDALRTVEVQA